jgi:hypothetical protein
MSLFPIFKVNKLTNKNKTGTIFVFYGTNLEEDQDPNELFKRDPKNKAFVPNVFTEKELDEIDKNKVIFLKQSIHIDDSIGVIKLKIFEALQRSVSMSEIYLFCLKNEKINPITMYQNLTQNDRLPLTRIRLEQMLKNIYDENGRPIDFELPKKDKYTFDDILNLDLTGKEYLVAKILGQKFVFNHEYPFVADPFYVTENDALLENSREELTTLNNSLLLESFPIFQKTIYLCIAPDVFSKKTDVSIEYTSKIYFPFLYQDRIDTIEKLDDSRDKLIEATSNKLTTDVEKGVQNVDMFYDIFQHKLPSKRFSEKQSKAGIKFIKIIMHPDFQVKIPIDVIFKLIHATKEFPLIKFNPETRQENIYRLYTEQMTADGRKIPFLNKAIIFKLVKNIGKSRSVAVYTNIIFEGIQYVFACEFADNGSITVYPLTDFEKAISIDKNSIDEILKLAVNPLIEQIKPFFEQSGLEILLFTGINSANIEIREITYQTVYSISKPIEINKYIGCVSSVFTIESSNLKRGGIDMRLKRVANFNKRDSQEAFIIEKIDQGFKFDEIVEELIKNYNDVDDEIAADLIAKIRNELEVTRGANRRRALMIKINPGFKTHISLDSILSEITVTVQGINDIYYLKTIPVYIDTLVRITQDSSSSKFSSSDISKLCSGKEIEGELDFGQITSTSEKNIEENQVPDIQGESPVYSSSSEIKMGENMDELLDILGFDEDESEEDKKNSSKGGKGTSSNSDSGEDVKTPVLSSASNSDSGEDVKTPDLSSSASSDSGEDVKTPDLSSSASSDSGEDVKTPDLSSAASSNEDPNKNEFDVKPIDIPTSKEDTKSSDKPSDKPSSDKEKEEEETSSVSKEETSTKSSSESKEEPSIKSSDKEEEEESKEKEIIEKPNPVVNVEVNVNKQPSPLKEKEKELSPVIVNVGKKEVSPTFSSSSSPSSLISPSSSSSSSSSSTNEVIELPVKKDKAKKEDKKELDNTVRDISGMKLRYPNPFSTRLEKRAPNLFVREKNDKIDVYTRMCPFSLSDRRQPVILSTKEKEELLKEHPDTNVEEDFIEYSTDPNDSSKKFYYTCPRFWCMLTDKMVTEEDILAGKCGPKVKKVEDAIIPKTADSIKNDGRYVYQFYDENEKKYPGFHKKKTPSGLCIPCCYNKWKTEEMKNRRDLCQGKLDETESLSNSGEEKEFEELKRNTQTAENYVKGPEKYGPQLGEKRWGFLPIAVQKFLHEVNGDCQVSKMDPSLKPDHTCILRHGVEINSKQSFIACIADAMFYAEKTGPRKNDPALLSEFIPNAKHDVPTIEEMKNKIIIPAIKIDNFVKYQNGDLITIFANLDAEVDINKPEYTKSELYKNIEKGENLYNMPERQLDNDNLKQLVEIDESDFLSVKKSSIEFFTRVVQAYENFITFLKDPTIYIDYTYLWDLICMPNSKLFDGMGINLIILEMPEDDITNNIELVCPTNRYSTHIYDARKPSLILIKRENYFEPVYGHHYSTKNDKLHVTKTFSEYDRQLPKNIRAIFTKIIKPTLGKRCKAFPSNEKEYKLKQPPLLDELIKDLMDKNGYTILYQVLNFQGKVIGLFVESPTKKKGFIPCYPSSLTTLLKSKQYNKKKCDIDGDNKCDFDFVYVSDTIWNPYEETLSFLKEYYDYKEPEPEHELDKNDYFGENSFCKVVNNGLIIGFLTNTNQFIRIIDPIAMSTVNDSICQITNNDTLVADIETLTTSNVDTERTDYIKRIQLETNFYNVFRNTIRILFNDYSNSEKRKKIQLECKERFISYNEQIKSVIKMLRDLVGSSMKFSTEEKRFKNINENEIHNCIKLSKDKCLNDEDPDAGICEITDDKCTLILPKKNLITQNDNETFYYSKMADELIRYNRIKSFIFKPQAYLSFGQIKYNLRDNEMLILQDLLTQEFFENLFPADINKYAKYNTYDTAEPIVSQKYKKNFELDEIINPNHERDCFSSEPTIIKSITWNKCFPKKYKEVAYKGKSKSCALYLLIDLIKVFKGEEKLIEDIKDDLINEYKKLTEDYKNSKRINTIIDILREEGQFDANQLQDGSMNFKQMISQEGFGAVNFDLWILLVKYKIPSIFISSKVIPESRFKYKEFVCYKDDENRFAFIVIPAMYKRQNLKNPEYKLIVDDNGEIPISLNVMIEENCSRNIDNAISRVMPIKKYIDVVFEKRLTTIHPRRKPDAVNIEFVEVSDTAEPELEEGSPKIFKQKKGRKLSSKTILEEDEDIIEPLSSNKEQVQAEDEEFEIELPRSSELVEKKKKKKSKKRNKDRAKAYPTRKNKRNQKVEDIEFDIVEE